MEANRAARESRAVSCFRTYVPSYTSPPTSPPTGYADAPSGKPRFLPAQTRYYADVVVGLRDQGARGHLSQQRPATPGAISNCPSLALQGDQSGGVPRYQKGTKVGASSILQDNPGQRWNSAS